MSSRVLDFQYCNSANDKDDAGELAMASGPIICIPNFSLASRPLSVAETAGSHAALVPSYDKGLR